MGTSKGFNIRRSHRREFPNFCRSFDIEDRIWSMAASPDGYHAVVGSSGHLGIPPLHLIDVENGTKSALPTGHLKRGAGMLDTYWLSDNTLLSCGYDTSARL